MTTLFEIFGLILIALNVAVAGRYLYEGMHHPPGDPARRWFLLRALWPLAAAEVLIFLLSTAVDR